LTREPIVVCLGYPALLEERFVARTRAVDPRIEVVRLPADPDGAWLRQSVEKPHDEPPAWALGCAAERRDALARCEVMIALATPRDLMDLAPRLRWVQGFGAGVEQFAAAGVRRDRVIVTNVSGISAASMAEFVLGRLLQVWKRFPESEAFQRKHEYVGTYGRTLAGSVLGIVGLGAIGCALGERARALGVHVLGLKRTWATGSHAADELFGPAQLHEMLGRCDAVVISAPATPATRYLIDAAALAAMKPGCMLVNVARGSLVDEAALLEALASGQLSAAALDVFEQEPLPAESPLWDAPNVYISAHSSVSIDRYVDDVFDVFEDNLRRYLAGETLRNQVDMEGLGFS
jgi:phosphoglycerate dehydrogenase-like enzyme